MNKLKLKRFWFKFNFPNDSIPSHFALGCGVTAWNYDDAVNIIREKVSLNNSIPTIKSFIEDIDVSTLDSGHVLPNMLPTNFRGVWYPIGYNF